MSTPLLRFYSGQIPDHRGRFVSEIQRWNSAELESVHDFIQWLFPLPEPSPVNPLAPVLDAATIAEFHNDAQLRAALLNSMRLMLSFYSFELGEGTEPLIRSLPGIETAHWLTPGNHNLLRITRILRSTRLLGLSWYSETFFDALAKLYATDVGRRAIGSVSFRYWQNAVRD